MDQIPLRRLETPLAKELAETLLLQHDMQVSLAAIKLWHEKYAEQEPNSEERLIGGCLFRDAVIQFVGCFDPSAQFPLSSDSIYGNDPGGPEMFKWFKDCRDAYAAHKFGAQRQCVVGIMRHPEAGLGVGQIFAIFSGPEKKDGPQLVAFMEKTAVYLDKRVIDLRNQILASARPMTDEQINALPLAAVHGVDPEDIRMSRPALQRARSNPGPSSTQSSRTEKPPSN